MVLLLLVLIPAVFGAVAFAMRDRSRKLLLLVACGALHFALSASTWIVSPAPLLDGALALDPLGLVVLSIASALFLLASVYSVAYVPREIEHGDVEAGRYVPSLCFFLSAMTLVAESAHLGLLWVAIEATTLASAPLVSFRRSAGALEAMWKYLLICSVGIALSLLGTFFLGIAFSGARLSEHGLLLEELLDTASTADRSWFRAAFLFAVVGYGTKMGLAPLHTWLPDAHSEAPSPVSALLSGALLNCAFLGILRFFTLAVAVGEAELARDVLVGFGLVSLAVAAGSILGSRDYKRLLAYSSVENMGILAIGVGVGGAASYGALLHAVNHSMGKALLFLLAGNVLLAFGTKEAARIRGVGRELPMTGALLVAGVFAIGGLPPFALFHSELAILAETVRAGRFVVAGLYFGLLAIAFVGMAAVLLPMTRGSRDGAELLETKVISTRNEIRRRAVGYRSSDSAARAMEAPRREPWLLVGPPLVLAAGLLILGVWIPPELDRVLRSAAALLGGAE